MSPGVLFQPGELIWVVASWLDGWLCRRGSYRDLVNNLAHREIEAFTILAIELSKLRELLLRRNL